MKIIAVACVVIFALGLRVSANSPNVTAPIFVVMCFDTGDILYERNMEQRWIPASMTKIMTAFITYEEMDAGNLTPDTRVRVSANAANFSQNRRIEGSFVPMQQGTYVTVETLLRLMMLPSGNAAAVVLAEHISGTEAAFVERMNQTAYELGMYSSFTNSHGAIAHHSNAHSIALLIREFIQRYPDILRITAMTSVNFGGTTYSNTNRLLSTHYFAGADGFKTGTIRASGWGHSTTAIRDGRRVIVVLMNTADNEARQSQSRTLLQFGFDELERRDIAAANRVRVYHNGTVLQLNAPAILHERQLLLPMSDVLRPLGFDLSWDGNYRIATAIDQDGGEISIFLDRNMAVVRGRTVAISTPARMFNNRVYISLDIINAIMGTNATWNFDTGVVQL